MWAVDVLDQYCLSECTARNCVRLEMHDTSCMQQLRLSTVAGRVDRYFTHGQATRHPGHLIYKQAHRYFIRARPVYPSRSSLISEIMLIACSSWFGICGAISILTSHSRPKRFPPHRHRPSLGPSPRPCGTDAGLGTCRSPWPRAPPSRRPASAPRLWPSLRQHRYH